MFVTISTVKQCHVDWFYSVFARFAVAVSSLCHPQENIEFASVFFSRRTPEATASVAPGHARAEASGAWIHMTMAPVLLPKLFSCASRWVCRCRRFLSKSLNCALWCTISATPARAGKCPRDISANHDRLLSADNLCVHVSTYVPGLSAHVQGERTEASNTHGTH